MIGGTLTGILLLQLFNSADPAAVFAPVITLIATYIDPGILSTVITAGGGALAALFVVGVVRMLRRGRRAAAAVPAAASRGTRLAGVAAAWVLFGAVAAVAAAVAIGGWPVDPTAAAAGLGRLVDAVASANALLRIGVIIGAAVAALLLSGAVVASFAAAAAAPSSDRRRSPAGPVLFAVLMVVGLVVGIAGARQMGLSIAAEPAATPSPSVTAEPSPSPSGSPAATPDPTVTLPGWVAIAPPGERFQARFPAAPTAGSVDSASAAGAVTSRTWTATADGATWMVIVSPYPNGVLDPTRSTEIIDGAISGAATRVSGTADSPTTVTSGALRGRETTIRTAAMTLRVRVYLVGTELWQATVGYARDAAAPDGVADFMAAIAAVDGATASPAPSGSPSGAGQLPVIGSTRPLPGSAEAARERLAGIESAFDPTPAVSAAADEPLDQGPVLQGRATFYDASRNHAWYTHSTPGSAYYNQDGAPYYTFYAAASPRLRAVAPFHWGGQPYAVSITNTANGRVITAFVVDECACVGGGVIDLAPAAWAALAGPGVPFSRGVLDVRVEILYGAEA
jgi:hypothetical protein